VTTERALNADTTLAERLRTLFCEQGVTFASLLSAFGFVVSTIVLAIQMNSGGVTPAPAPPTPGSEGTVAVWVKTQLKTLAVWLKTLARKGDRGAAWSYWCNRLVPPQDCGLSCCLACGTHVGSGSRFGRRGCGLLSPEVVDYGRTHCRDGEKSFCALVARKFQLLVNRRLRQQLLRIGLLLSL